MLDANANTTRGRPKGRQKTVGILFRATAEENEAIAKVAASEHMPRAIWVRRTLLKAVEAANLPTTAGGQS